MELFLTQRLDKIPEVCNAVAGVLPGVGLVLQTGPSVLAPLVARTRADGDRIAAIHMIPPIAVRMFSLVAFDKNISRTSVVSSTNFGSTHIFASCVVGTVLVI